MLVISRRTDEEIVFPTINVTLKLLRIEGNRARIGIQAPKHVDVMRGEIADADQSHIPFNEQLRKELNAVTVQVQLYDQLIERGEFDKAHIAYLEILSKLKGIDDTCAGKSRESVIPPHDSPNVLVVEDDANERELLAGVLRMEGCNVTTAVDGIDAIGQLESLPKPDLVLLDMNMPRADGRETLKLIRSSQALAKLPVFVVSGRRPEDIDVALATEGQIDRWFQKPLNPSLLMSAIQSVYQEHSALTA